MGWNVVISPGLANDSNAFKVTDKFKFDLQAKTVDNDLGQVLYTEFTIEIEGDVVASTPALVANGFLNNTLNQILQYTPRNVYLVLDGTTQYTFSRTNCVGSPRVTAVRTVDQDGNTSSHWRYALTIYAKLLGSIGASELSTSLMVKTEQGSVTKKVWRAFAKSTSAAAALAKILQFKPSDPTLTEEIERRFQECAALGVWTWDLYKNYDITEEPVEFMGMGNSWIWEYNVGDGNNPPPPVLHRAANEIVTITIRGVVRNTDKSKLFRPNPHFVESPSLKHNQAAEKFYLPAISEIDVTRQVWSQPFEEIWLWDGTGAIPVPNHGSHAVPILLAPSPPDGIIAGQ